MDGNGDGDVSSLLIVAETEIEFNKNSNLLLTVLYIAHCAREMG